MEVSEAKKEKLKLESAINNAIQEFQKVTGLSVKEINISTIEVVGSDKIFQSTALVYL